MTAAAAAAAVHRRRAFHPRTAAFTHMMQFDPTRRLVYILLLLIPFASIVPYVALAVAAFKYMMQFEPHRLDGLEFLSSCLWHLDRQVDLCYLAQRALDFDRLHPVTW
jgi:hypothetical protein